MVNLSAALAAAAQQAFKTLLSAKPRWKSFISFS
jgi:hypothetical protein